MSGWFSCQKESPYLGTSIKKERKGLKKERSTQKSLSLSAKAIKRKGKQRAYFMGKEKREKKRPMP